MGIKEGHKMCLCGTTPGFDTVLIVLTLFSPWKDCFTSHA